MSSAEAPRARCPDLGMLRQALDDDAAQTIHAHAAHCDICAERLTALQAAAADVASSLGGAPPPDTFATAAAYQRFRARLRHEDVAGAVYDDRTAWSGGFMARFWSSRAARSMSAVAVVVIVMMAVAVSPARGLADGVLDRFRVQKFAAITIPMDMLDQVQSGALVMPDSQKQALQDEFNQLGAFESTLNMQSARQVESVDAARAAYGDLAVPSSLPTGFTATPDAYVSDAGTASYTLNVGEADALVQRLGLPIFSLPDATQYPTLTFTAEIPAAAVLDYQNADSEHLFVGQMESPTLDIPQGIDLNALRDEVLQLPGLPADLVAQLRQVKDWQHTLIVPVPSGASTDDVTMHGEPALLIEGNNGEGSAVLWQKDGVLYVVAGQVDRDALLATAAALR